jgi:hypothetical protein
MDKTIGFGIPPKQEEVRKSYTIPSGALLPRVQKEQQLKEHPRAVTFDNDKQRNARDISKGLAKPGSVGYDTLRRASRSVHIVRICITTLKEMVTKTKWQVGPKDPLADEDKLKGQIEEVTKLLRKPNPRDTWRTFLDKTLEDLLAVDAVAWEKVRFPDGDLAELYHVDSTTIHPVFDEHGLTDIEIPLFTEKGGLTQLPASYLQVLNYSQYGGPESGDIVAAWPKEDMALYHMHPQGTLEGFGFGLSPIESVLSVVANILNADNYNGTYFEEGSFPPVILQLMGQVNERDLEAYREYLLGELSGNFHRPAVMAGAEEIKVHNLKDLTQRDMQFMEYQNFLARLMSAAYGLSPQDIGITDEVGSKNVAEVQKDLSQKKGYKSILHLVKEQINLIIEEDFGYTDIEFDFVSDDTIEPKDLADIVDKRLKQGTMTLNEAREAYGDTPFGTWASEPALLSSDGQFMMLGPSSFVDPEEMRQQEQDANEAKTEALRAGAEQKKGGDDEEEKPAPKKAEKMRKAVFTKQYRV